MNVSVTVAESGIREMPTQRRDALMTFIDCLMLDTDINPFCYDPVAGSRVLSGKEEAVFDWISVNYLLGNFVGKRLGVKEPLTYLST